MDDQALQNLPLQSLRTRHTPYNKGSDGGERDYSGSSSRASGRGGVRGRGRGRGRGEVGKSGKGRERGRGEIVPTGRQEKAWVRRGRPGEGGRREEEEADERGARARAAALQKWLEEGYALLYGSHSLPDAHSAPDVYGATDAHSPLYDHGASDVHGTRDGVGGSDYAYVVHSEKSGTSTGKSTAEAAKPAPTGLSRADPSAPAQQAATELAPRASAELSSSKGASFLQVPFLEVEKIPEGQRSAVASAVAREMWTAGAAHIVAEICRQRWSNGETGREMDMEEWRGGGAGRDDEREAWREAWREAGREARREAWGEAKSEAGKDAGGGEEQEGGIEEWGAEKKGRSKRGGSKKQRSASEGRVGMERARAAMGETGAAWERESAGFGGRLSQEEAEAYNRVMKEVVWHGREYLQASAGCPLRRESLKTAPLYFPFFPCLCPPFPLIVPPPLPFHLCTRNPPVRPRRPWPSSGSWRLTQAWFLVLNTPTTHPPPAHPQPSLVSPPTPPTQCGPSALGPAAPGGWRLTQACAAQAPLAQQRLVAAHSSLVRSIARRFFGHGVSLSDLYHAGVTALLRAAATYNPTLASPASDPSSQQPSATKPAQSRARGEKEKEENERVLKDEKGGKVKAWQEDEYGMRKGRLWALPGLRRKARVESGRGEAVSGGGGVEAGRGKGEGMKGLTEGGGAGQGVVAARPTHMSQEAMQREVPQQVLQSVLHQGQVEQRPTEQGQLEKDFANSESGKQGELVEEKQGGFEEQQAMSFSSWASRLVYQTLQQEVWRRSPVFSFPRYAYFQYAEISAAYASFRKQHAREPTLADLSAATSLSPQRIVTVSRAMRRVKNPLSFDVSLLPNRTHAETFSNDKADPWQHLLDSEHLVLLSHALSTLDPHRRLILELRFGLRGSRQVSQEEVSACFHLP
ncbi:unnamed protein product [Closterium sp. NIES-64]|nr:unnamed protein product [Closterium sp. NIES-64]